MEGFRVARSVYVVQTSESCKLVNLEPFGRMGFFFSFFGQFSERVFFRGRKFRPARPICFARASESSVKGALTFVAPLLFVCLISFVHSATCDWQQRWLLRRPHCTRNESISLFHQYSSASSQTHFSSSEGARFSNSLIGIFLCLDWCHCIRGYPGSAVGLGVARVTGLQKGVFNRPLLFTGVARFIASKTPHAKSSPGACIWL